MYVAGGLQSACVAVIVFLLICLSRAGDILAHHILQGRRPPRLTEFINDGLPRSLFGIVTVSLAVAAIHGGIGYSLIRAAKGRVDAIQRAMCLNTVTWGVTIACLIAVLLAEVLPLIGMSPMRGGP